MTGLSEVAIPSGFGSSFDAMLLNSEPTQTSMKRAYDMKRMMTAVLAGTLGLAGTLAMSGCSKEETPAAPPIRTTKAPPPPVTPKPPVEPEVTPAPPVTPPVEVATKPTTVTPTSLPTATPPATQPAIEVPPAGSLKQDPKVATFLGFTGPKPATWLSKPPTSQFIDAEFAVPGRDGADQGRITVSAAGGSHEMNIARWQSQFRAGPNGGTVEPTLSKIETAELTIEVVELAGEYRGMGGSFSPEQKMITGIVPSTNNQNVFIKFVGPAKTVDLNREAFMELLKGLKHVDGQK